MRAGLALRIAAPALLLAGCASVHPVGPGKVAVVTAVGETAPVGTGNADAADDPAIWRNPRRPGASLIVATDKKAGLHVYGLDGQSRSFVPAGRVNNVDLVDLGRRGVIVVASDRNDERQARLLVYRLDTATARLIPLGSVDGGMGEAYGICLLARGKSVDVFSVLKEGTVHQVSLTLAGDAVSGSLIRTFRVASQPEGCVADPRDGTLYVGEEARGIWAFATDGTSDAGRLVAEVDGSHLVADVEGLALMPQGRSGGWLIASSQGDNAYALFRLPGMEPAGRFRIGAGTFGATEETDGIAVAKGSFGPAYPGGLFVAQDGHNAPQPQNFKFVSWRSITAALAKRRNLPVTSPSN